MFEIKETNGVYTVAGSGCFEDLVKVISVEAKTLLDKRQQIMSSETARTYLSAYMMPRQREAFWAFYLNSQHDILEAKMLFSGSIDSATVYVREVVVDALRANAAAVIASS